MTASDRGAPSFPGAIALGRVITCLLTLMIAGKRGRLARGIVGLGLGRENVPFGRIGVLKCYMSGLSDNVPRYDEVVKVLYVVGHSACIAVVSS